MNLLVWATSKRGEGVSDKRFRGVLCCVLTDIIQDGHSCHNCFIEIYSKAKPREEKNNVECLTASAARRRVWEENTLLYFTLLR